MRNDTLQFTPTGQIHKNRPVHDTVPPTASFVDSVSAYRTWYPVVEPLDVPTPQSATIELDTDVDGMPEWDTEAVIEAVEQLGGHAHLRGELTAGSRVYELQPHESQVNVSIGALLADHSVMQLSHGDRVYAREWLSLDDGDGPVHRAHHPEVRFFCRNGTPVCHHLRMDSMDILSVDTIEAALDAVAEDIDELQRYATRVATAVDDELEHNYSVDFVQDTDGDWWLTDMAVDALYSTAEHGGAEDDWRCISAHPPRTFGVEQCPHDYTAEHWLDPDVDAGNTDG